MSQRDPRKKGFVRIDAQGRVIPGTLVLRNKKPSIGKWLEIAASTCCTTTTVIV